MPKIDKNSPIISEIMQSLKKQPSDFPKIFSRQSNKVLLALMDEIKEQDEKFILKLFAIQHIIFSDYYTVFYDLVSYPSRNDSCYIALLDVIKKLSDYSICSLLLAEEHGFTQNNLFFITRDHSVNVIEKAFSIILRLNPYYRDKILKTEHVFYSKYTKPCNHISNSYSYYRAHYGKTPVSAAFDRKNDQKIALIIVRKINLMAKPILLTEKIFQEALYSDNKQVICYLLEQPDFPVDKILLSEKRAYEAASVNTIALIDSLPLHRAIHQPISSPIPYQIKMTILASPKILEARWSKENTLLHLAAEKNHIDALQFLLTQSTDVNAVNSDGLTVFDLAFQNNEKESIRLIIENGKINLHQACKNTIWPIQRIMHTQQYSLIKRALTILLKALPNEGVFSSLAQTLLDTKSYLYHQSDTDTLNDALSQSYHKRPINDSLTSCCETTNNATGLLLQTIGILYSDTGNLILKKAIDNYLRHQINSLLSCSIPNNQQAVRAYLIVFLFSQSISSIHLLLNQQTWSIDEKIQLDIILTQALTTSFLYKNLSYEEHLSFIEFLEPKSQQQLIKQHLLHSNLALLPSSLLRYFSTNSTFPVLYKTYQQRIDPLLMIITLEKYLQEESIDHAIIHTVQESIKQELLHLSTHASLHELRFLLNFITHTDIKLFIKQHLIESNLNDLFLNLSLVVPEPETELITKSIEKDSLLSDIFLTIASNPNILLQPRGDMALMFFIRQASIQEIETLVTTYGKILYDQDDEVKNKLNSCLLRALLDDSVSFDGVDLEHLIRILIQWSIAYSSFTSEQDEFLSYMPFLLNITPSYVWEAIDSLLIDVNNSYTASIKLLKDGRNIQNSLSFLKKNIVIRYDASLIFLKGIQLTLEVDLFSLDSQLAIEAVVLFLSQKTYTDISRLLDNLPNQLINLLLEHALSGMTSDDYFRAKTCKTLLTYLAQTNFTNNLYHLTCIKQRLSEQNLFFLNETHLIDLAQNILNTKDTSLNDATYNGVWIQRLITSIPFIASITPEILYQLTERYRLLSLSLKQDEFHQLNRWISGKLSYAKHHSHALERVRQDMLQDPARHEHLLAKRNRLLDFRADDSIRALLNQLEDACIHQQDETPELADKALHVLYTYINQRLSSLRSDYLFKVCNAIFTRFRRGDIEMAQNSLLQWLAHYLPYQNFEQSELAKKNDFRLYDSNNQYIGFINESNYAMTFFDDELCSLIKMDGFSPGFVLYNKHRLRIGELTATGEVKYTNLFQKSTSALMIAKVPKVHLEQSKPALDLLMYDLLHHGELKTLYECEEMAHHSEQRAWVEKELETRLTDIQHTLNPDIIAAIAMFHSNESALTLLSTIPNEESIRLLFKAILEQEEKRTALFEQGFSFLTKSLSHDSTVTLFSDYLTRYHNKSWFSQGLLLFAQSQSSNDKRAILLLEALDKFESDRSLVLDFLLATETQASIILYDFLSDDKTISIQAAQTSSIDAFTSCLSIKHITCLLKALPEDKPLFTRAQYRLLLLAFLAHHERLFPAKELRLSKTHAWHANDLLYLTQFTKRHWKEGASLDKEYAIGQKIISELALRAANFGQTNLFYNKKQFDCKMAKHVLTRSRIDTIVTSLTCALTSTFQYFLQKFDRTQEEIALLEKEGSIINWEKIKEDSWKFSTGNTLPLITLFLLNYSGQTETVKQLIEDVFNSSITNNDKTIFYYITQLLHIAPSRDIAQLIFNVLHEQIINNPSILDKTILNHMALYYAKGNLKFTNKTDLTAQHLELIRFFGQQKQYNIVLILCQLIHAPQKYSALLNHIKKEAKVEHKLQPFIAKWYFSLFAFFIRTWNYFGKSPSTYVKYCDNQEETTFTKKNPAAIHVSVLGGEIIERQLEHHHDMQQVKNIKSRLSELNSIGFRTDLQKQSKRNTCSFSIHSLFSIFGNKKQRVGNKCLETSPALIDCVQSQEQDDGRYCARAEEVKQRKTQHE